MNKDRDQKDVLIFRHEVQRAIRSHFNDQGFIEIETPYLLTANTPDPFIDPLLVHSQFRNEPYQLHTSPEIWLKRALALGFSKIYELGKVFRDDPLDASHSREFTMLEWYRTDADLNDLINDCDHLFAITAKQAGKKQPHPFIRTDLPTLFTALADIDLISILKTISEGEADHLQKILLQKGDHLPKNASFSDAFFHVMLKYIEPNLPFDKPVVISKWPVQLAALAAPCEEDPNLCDRFEIYFRGLEIANAYQECNDQNVLRSRFIKENCDRRALNKPSFPIDEKFLASVSLMPKTAGIALGIDRLFQAILGKRKISDIIWGMGDQ